MGGLWVDYTLMSNVSGLFVLGEANFSDHGSNRLGASALMQGLSDGYFVAPYTITNYLASTKPGDVTTDHPDFKRCENDVNENIKKFFPSRAIAVRLAFIANWARWFGMKLAWLEAERV